MSTFRSFSELIKDNMECIDFTINSRHTDSAIAVIAPHGGRIEPGTDNIAKAISEYEHSYYALCGIKKNANRELHITSTKFDEPQGLYIVQNADTVVAIHGSMDTGSTVHLGGRHEPLKEQLYQLLTIAGFTTTLCTSPGLSGQHPRNICNLCKGEKGVQLELSRGLRESMFYNLGEVHQSTSPLFDNFIKVVRKCLKSYQHV